MRRRMPWGASRGEADERGWLVFGEQDVAGEAAVDYLVGCIDRMEERLQGVVMVGEPGEGGELCFAPCHSVRYGLPVASLV